MELGSEALAWYGPDTEFDPQCSTYTQKSKYVRS